MRSTEIEQIRDILKNIENSSSQNEKINYSFEACKLIFENNKIEAVDFQSLEAEDIILDSILSMDEIVKYTANFLDHSLKYLEVDLKGSDFESEIQSNLNQLQKLNVKFSSSTKQYTELSETKQEVQKIQSEIEELQVKIDEYSEIDLEKMKLEKEQMSQKLKELEKNEGDNLRMYRKHLEENGWAKLFNSKLLDLSSNIKKDLYEMDKSLKNTIMGENKNGN